MNKIFKSRSRFFRIWDGLFKRVGKYKNYIDIKVSKEWEIFDNFYNDMYQSYCNHVDKHGEKNTTIERVDRNDNYYKENCIWATSLIQANNRSSGVYLTHGGETKSASEWARELGLTRQALSQRINKGWSFDRIFNTRKKQGRVFIIKNLIEDVKRGKYGTKKKSRVTSNTRRYIKIPTKLPKNWGKVKGKKF